MLLDWLMNVPQIYTAVPTSLSVLTLMITISVYVRLDFLKLAPNVLVSGDGGVHLKRVLFPNDYGASYTKHPKPKSFLSSI